MTGREVLHYRIDASLGHGGMGEVFRATDKRLGRTVALKFLPDSLAREPAHRARFMLEAQATSRLSSPFIARLFDVGDDDGALFLVMEFVEGETLSARLAGGAFPVAEAIRVATQMADALATAHEAGVIHRDVKPSNVMIDRTGQVKMLDFGLAKLVGPELTTPPTVVVPPLTTPGTVLGTVNYMSPEQAMGAELDHRTDLFSLGVVLYEMLCGVRPFRGDATMAVLHQILHAPTPPLEGRAAHAPEVVRRVVRRALEKDRERRYQTAREMGADLAAWDARPDPPVDRSGSEAAASSPGVVMKNTVVVATFANLTRRAEDDWLGTGIAETVTADLKRVKGLTVIDRERACACDAEIACSGATPSDPAFAVAAGRAVGAAWVVAGGFQRSGDQLRVTARFSETATGAVLRTVKLDGSISSIFELQDRIVAELCDGLDLDLVRSEIEAIRRHETSSVDAYRAYSSGLASLRSAEPEAFDRAIDLLADAVEIDPAYSVAWAALGSAHCLKGFFLGRRDLVREALDFERKAIALDPNNALAHEWLGMALLYVGEVEEAIAAAREAMRLDPNLASARAAHGRAYWFGRGMIEEGIRELERSTVLDPNLGYAYLQLAFLYAITGDFERAEAASRRAVELEDRNASGTLGLKMVGARTRLGYVLYRTGRCEEAVAEYLAERRTVEAGGHALRDRALIEIDQKLGAAYLKLGREPEAAEWLERAVANGRERAARHPLDPATSYYLACAHALRGEVAPALEALRRAMEGQPTITALRALRDPDLESLVDRPDFRRLVAAASGEDAAATNVG